MEELIQNIFASNTQLVLAVTGGGAGVIQQLLTVPGCSACVLEAIVPYANASLTDWLGSEPKQFASDATARQMAMRAWQRGRQLISSEDADDGNQYANLVGIGVTAALATSRPKRGDHRIHVAVQTTVLTRSFELVLEKNVRTRREEDDVASQIILESLAEVAGIDVTTLSESLRETENVVRREAIASSPQQELLQGARDWLQIESDQPTDLVRAPICLFPGAFNPMHAGHEKMLSLARQITGREVAAEICVQNVDKPPLDYWDMQTRAAQFAGICPVVITRAGTFVEKAKLFPESIFIVGADTISRISHARYYGDDPFARDAALQQLADWNVRFLVFGRTLADGHFAELDDLKLPGTLEKLCTRVREHDFREDISSTQLRGEE